MVQEQPGRVGRRLSAILAADVVGYSRLMGLDEVGTARTLREHRTVTDAIVARHGGRIVKTTGDGLLLEFPSVVDAVECAITVQAAMAERNGGIPQDRRMLLRIGINLGDILIEGDDILGDGVNVAARLESIAEPGGICISSSAYEQVRGKIDVEFTDLGEQNLKNIARPVRAYAVARDGFRPGARDSAATQNRPFAPHLSIVVLPFANIGGNPEQDYFVDGVTESLTTDLSRINGALVIARNTAFTFKNKAVPVKQIGQELNVRYVLEGSMQRSGNRLRVNVQLIDAETGNHLWAERFDKPEADLFDMQDEIVSRLANTLDIELVEAEARRSERAQHPDAMDLYFQGRACWHRGLTNDNLARSRSFLERALALDPGNINALVGMANIDATVGLAFLSDDRAARLAAAEAELVNALKIVPQHAFAHKVLGLLQVSTKRATQGIAHLQQALAIDRNSADAHAFIGNAKYLLGRGLETEAHVNEALRLSPRDSFAGYWRAFVGFSRIQLSAYDEAIEWLRHGLKDNYNYPLAHFHLAAALALLGSLGEARQAAQDGLALDPTFTIQRLRANVPSDNPVYLAGRERLYEGMRLSGVPEA
ncbi:MULTISPECIES: adenylate/guanylate cyclase domain-containing protein [unclassified Bradyrhizobium]|uniref:adenylate/guanylate cyclase domain-containing protein n=1 Tax=unclassified Bradyrhizobium TaxID=2631580 RepID=UPI0004067130|nr:MULTISPECIES: adenylate/guanylate cyclase domain-containing protein [unclassified Bradyrhizobium]QIG98811.1 adenylate/guanylate cyclase domain-containing protein [Bradyrhizobium sp. 6(2017)]